jgi:hypothetical protein
MLEWRAGMRSGAATLIGIASIGMKGKNICSQVSPSIAGTVNPSSAALLVDLTEPDRKRFFPHAAT